MTVPNEKLHSNGFLMSNYMPQCGPLPVIVISKTPGISVSSSKKNVAGQDKASVYLYKQEFLGLS